MNNMISLVLITVSSFPPPLPFLFKLCHVVSCVSQVSSASRSSSINSGLWSWPKRTSSSSPTVACEAPSPSRWGSCWPTARWSTCSSRPSSPSSSSPSLCRWEMSSSSFDQQLHFCVLCVCRNKIYTSSLLFPSSGNDNQASGWASGSEEEEGEQGIN